MEVRKGNERERKRKREKRERREGMYFGGGGAIVATTVFLPLVLVGGKKGKRERERGGRECIWGRGCNRGNNSFFTFRLSGR